MTVAGAISSPLRLHHTPHLVIYPAEKAAYYCPHVWASEQPAMRAKPKARFNEDLMVMFQHITSRPHRHMSRTRSSLECVAWQRPNAASLALWKCLPNIWQSLPRKIKRLSFLKSRPHCKFIGLIGHNCSLQGNSLRTSIHKV